MPNLSTPLPLPFMCVYSHIYFYIIKLAGKVFLYSACIAASRVMFWLRLLCASPVKSELHFISQKLPVAAVQLL